MKVIEGFIECMNIRTAIKREFLTYSGKEGVYKARVHRTGDKPYVAA